MHQLQHRLRLNPSANRISKQENVVSEDTVSGQPNTGHTDSKCTNCTVPMHLLPWLMATGSLTAMLEAKSGQPLIVERTFEGYRPLTLAQKKQLGYRGYQLNRPVLGWVREVLLYGNASRPWIRAQSIFPVPSLKGNAKRLPHLQSLPIGYVLFKRQVTLPSHRCINYTNQGWQRQTVYDWQGRVLIVSETFLSGF